MPNPSSSSPLLQLIQRLLQESDSPVALLDLQARLRRHSHMVPLDRLRAILSDRRVFTALAGDRYLLRDQFASPAEQVGDEEVSQSAPAPLFLISLPQAQDTYVVLDLETSGRDATVDQIVQIAALLVVDGRPSRFRSWYVQCDPAYFSPTLRRVLGLTDELIAEIAAAPPLDVIVPQVQEFVAEHTLVIHNARFDTAFLWQALPDFHNSVVDTMELALLTLPHAPYHKLSGLGEQLGIKLNEVSTEGITGVPTGHVISAETLHNAVTDVMLLDAVYRVLLRRWRDLPEAHIRFVSSILPEMSGALGLGRASLAEILSATVSRPSNPLPPLEDQDALALLGRVLAHTGRGTRPSQEVMAGLITEAFAGDSLRLIEAPTGTGKTLAYLIPAIWFARRDGRRIAIATALKNLQDQVRDEVRRLQRVVPFRAEVLKGASSYLCLRDLQQALEDAPATDVAHRYVLSFLARWATTYLSDTLPSLDEIPYWLISTFPTARDLIREVAVDRASCTEQRCPFFEHCHLFEAYRRAEQADLLLINHSLWLSPPAQMPAFDSLVLDEAHNLEDRATSAFQEEVSEASLRATLRRLAVPNTRQGALQRVLDLKPDNELRELVHRTRRAVGQGLRLIVDLRDTLGLFLRACDERLKPEEGAQLRLEGRPASVHPIRWKPVQQALDQLWRIFIAEIVAGLGEIGTCLPAGEYVLWRQIDAARQSLLDQQRLLGDMLSARRRDWVTWLDVQTEGDEPGWGLFTAPISVAPMLAEAYRRLQTVVLTSATLTTGPHDFSFIIERLGLRERLHDRGAHTLPGALPYAQHALLGLPTYLTYTPAQTTQQSFIEELAAELTQLCYFTDGNTLTLFTARARLEEVWARSRGPLEQHQIPVLAQRAGESRQRLVELFREGGAVLFGLRSFWEGVDVPGKALSFVVMEKLPYPALTDPIHAARREAVAQRSGREFQDYLFPLMVIQFKQGFGRLLRDEQDRGAVIVYDKRITRKSYLPELLGALPGFLPRDTVAERSRRAFYRMLGEQLPDRINLEAKADWLEKLPDVLSTDLEALVARLALPDPIPDEDYNQWRPRILEALQELYNHQGFRSPEQEEALRAMLTGRDVVAVLPTGAGKSLCFQLPALLRPGLTIVCSPLIALMRDQIEKLYDRGIEIAAALMSGQSAAEREEVLGRARSGRLRLLYLAPERLRDPVVLAALSASPVRQIVVDEAHCVALWGPSFRPDFLALPQVYLRLAHRPPIAAFTATATPAITSAIEMGLQLDHPTLVRAPIDRPELRLLVLDRYHRYHPVRSKNDQIRRLLMLVRTADARGETMLIYVATTNQAEDLARLLQVAGYAARAYHGKMEVQERANVGELFMDDLITIVVCTKAFGMGIDKRDIRYVVHFNVPGDLESYAQEVGRAGRDKVTSYAVLLYHPSDERIQRFFIEQSRPDSNLLARLWRWISERAEVWTLDPTVACEQFDLDELELRRALYLLERVGLIERGPDVTLRGNLTLLGGWEEVLALVPGHRPLLERLRIVMPMLGWERQEFMLGELSEQIDCSPDVLEHALIALAVVGGCLYRPWEKGYQIRRRASPDTTLPVVGSDVVTAQEQKLERMRDFVGSGACRWQELRRYFGQVVGEPCGTCDRCASEQRYPWSGQTERDVPDVSAVLDLATTLLEVVDWNERRRQDGYAPFGTKTLIRILRGEEFALMRDYPPGPKANARRATLRSCPYWGVCRTLRRSAADLRALLKRLHDEHFLIEVEIPAERGSSYFFSRLTDRGRAQLMSSERLGWDIEQKTRLS